MQKISSEIKSLKQEITDLKFAVNYQFFLNNFERLKNNVCIRSLIEKINRDLREIDQKQYINTIKIKKMEILTQTMKQNISDFQKLEDNQECFKETMNANQTEFLKFKLMTKLSCGKPITNINLLPSYGIQVN